MVSRNVVFWEVDTQADFMLPGGKLYVPGAERLLPNIRRLTDAARQGRVFLVSHGCYHVKDDPEFQTFPPHCIKGTAGSEFVPEALTEQGRHRSERNGHLDPAGSFKVSADSSGKTDTRHLSKAATSRKF